MTEKVEPYLELSNNPVRFEAVNQVTNVFFDDSNKQGVYENKNCHKNCVLVKHSISSNVSYLTAYSSSMSLYSTAESDEFEVEKGDEVSSLYLTAENSNQNLLEKCLFHQKKSNFDIYNAEKLEKFNEWIEGIYENFIFATPVEICDGGKSNYLADSNKKIFIQDAKVTENFNKNQNYFKENITTKSLNDFQLSASVFNKNKSGDHTELVEPKLLLKSRSLGENVKNNSEKDLVNLPISKKEIRNSNKIKIISDIQLVKPTLADSMPSKKNIEINISENLKNVLSVHKASQINITETQDKNNSVNLTFLKVNTPKQSKHVAFNSFRNQTNNTKDNILTAQINNSNSEVNDLTRFNLLDKGWLTRPIKILKCFICHDILPTRKQYKYHLFLHRDEIEQCPVCPKRYRKKCHLTQHMARCHN